MESGSGSSIDIRSNGPDLDKSFGRKAWCRVHGCVVRDSVRAGAGQSRWSPNTDCTPMPERKSGVNVTDLFLAVDGGQSGTVAILATADGTILGTGRGGPIRHHEEPNAEQIARDGVTAAVNGAMRGSDHRRIRACCVAMTGSARIADRVIHELVTVDHYVALESDTFAALASGTADKGGIGLIAGTGTVALAKGNRGQKILGGWGWLLGDEGGGFWIAIEALKAAVRDVDGTGPRTTLTHELQKKLGQKDMRGVYNVVTGQRLDRTAIAAMTPRVFALAEAGDDVAAGILNSAATHLADLVVALIAEAPFLEPDERVVVACGGVLSAHGWVVKRLAVELAHRAPGFALIVPAAPPAVGAYYLALESAGVPIDSTLQELVTRQIRSLPDLVSKRTPILSKSSQQS